MNNPAVAQAAKFRPVFVPVLVVALLSVGSIGVVASPASNGAGSVSPGADVMVDEVGGVPLLAGAYTQGGELADGVRVPQGTALLGSLFPTGRVTGSATTTGWRGLFVALGSLTDLLDDLNAQASRLGLQPESQGGQTPSCRVAHRGHAWLCEGTWRNETAYLSMHYTRGLVPPDHQHRHPDLLHTQQDRPTSLLVLSFGRWQTAAGAAGEPREVPPVIPCLSSRLGAAASRPVTTPTGRIPRGWEDPPRSGAILGDGIVPEHSPAVVGLELPEGAEAVVAPWPNNARVPSYGAIVAVRGELDSVWQSLTERVRSRLAGEVEYQTSRLAAGEVRWLSGANAERDCYALQAVTHNGRSWVAVFTGYEVVRS